MKSPPIKAVVNCEIMQAGRDLFRRFLLLIQESREVIHIQFYILEEDEIGRRIQEALIEASQRGVKIFILLDGFGSWALSSRFLEKFSNSGIEVCFFSPPKFSIPFRLGPRLHHKIAVFDYSNALIGGFNIANRYKGNEHTLPWLDFVVFIEGSICVKLHKLAANLIQKQKLRFKDLGKLWKKSNDEEKFIRIRQNDLLRGKKEIRKGYIRAIRNARHSITIVASYFLPDQRMINLLCQTAKKGIEIKVILPFISDAPFYKLAVKKYYPRLLQCGIKIYEYTPTVLHAKGAVVDGAWCTIGSYNLNELSDYVSIELNIEIFQSEIASGFNKLLDDIIQNDCREVLIDQEQKISFFSTLKRKISYWGIRQSIWLMYWFTEKGRRNLLE